MTDLSDVLQQDPLAEAHAILEGLEHLLVRQLGHVHAVGAEIGRLTHVFHKPKVRFTAGIPDDEHEVGFGYARRCERLTPVLLVRSTLLCLAG